MKLSENFSLLELTKSQTAERKGINNTPSAEHQDNLKSLCTHVLQPILYSHRLKNDLTTCKRPGGGF